MRHPRRPGRALLARRGKWDLADERYAWCQVLFSPKDASAQEDDGAIFPEHPYLADFMEVPISQSHT